MIQTRLLTRDDRSAIELLAKAVDSLFKVPVTEDYEAAFWKNVDDYLDPAKGDHQMVGAFENGELICFAGLYFWKSLPFWTMTNLKTKPSLRGIGPRQNGLTACYEAALSIAEKRGVYTVYSLGPVRGQTGKPGYNVFQRLIPALRRYEFVVEAYIPAGHQPRYAYHWNLMSSRTYPVDLAIIAGTLKQEFRPMKSTALAVDVLPT